MTCTCLRPGRYDAWSTECSACEDAWWDEHCTSCRELITAGEGICDTCRDEEPVA